MLLEVRTAIAAQVTAQIPDLQVEAYALGQPSPPSAYLIPGPIDYDLAMHRGLDSWQILLRAFVAMNNDQAAQIALDKYLEPHGTYSIKRAVEVDVTLGGLVAAVQVTHCEGYQEYEFPGRGVVLGSEWTLEVTADG